ncbi:MAG: hypothetical protein Q8S71_04635, partial [Hydrogenophaga sp.]|nr:hypothetical protein [Hydrogenophaga sp.]
MIKINARLYRLDHHQPLIDYPDPLRCGQWTAARPPSVFPSQTPVHVMKFQGSQNYVATQDLMLAVNAAITL